MARRRTRFTGPAVGCGAGCESGIVDRQVTEEARVRLAAQLLAKAEAAEERAPTKRQLAAAARRAYPFRLCGVCGGLGVVPAEAAGDWYETGRPGRPCTGRRGGSGRRGCAGAS